MGKSFAIRYRLKRGGPEYELSFDWEASRLLFDGYDEYDEGIESTTPFELICKRHPATTKRGKTRFYSVKPLLHVLGLPLSKWQRLGA